MKYFMFFVFAISGNLFAQKSDTLRVGPVNLPDGDDFYNYVRDCKLDTLIKIHENALLVISDSSSFKFSFESGTKKYIEIIITLNKCRCSHCDYTEHIIIDYVNLSDKESVSVDSNNSIWFRRNSSLVKPDMRSNFKGKLTKDENKYSLTLNKYSSEKSSKYVMEETTELKNLQVKQ